MARDSETGEPIPLEIGSDGSTDAPRYRVLRIEDGRPVVERVGEEASGAFQADHRYDCPGFNAGR